MMQEDEEFVNLETIRNQYPKLKKIYQIQPTGSNSRIKEVGEFEGELYHSVIGSFSMDYQDQMLNVVLAEILHDDESLEKINGKKIPFLELNVGNEVPFLKICAFVDLNQEFNFQVHKDEMLEGSYSITAYQDDRYRQLEAFQEFSGMDQLVEKMLGYLHLIL